MLACCSTVYCVVICYDLWHPARTPPHRSHRREYGEPIPGRVLAERLGEFLHLACVRWGSRAYPNALFIACWGERDRGNENCDSGGGGAHLSGWSSDSSETAEIAVTSEEAGVGVGVGAGAGAGVEVGVGVGGEATSKLGIVAGKQDNGWLRKRKERVGEGDEQEKGKEDKEKKGEVGEEVAGEEEEGDEGKDGEEEGEQGKEKEEREGATTGGMDSGFRLYMVDPSGASRRYKAACTGRGGARARKWLHSSFAGDEDGRGRSWDKKEGDAAEVEEEEEEKEGGQEELEGEDDADAIDGEGSSRDGSEARGQGRAGTDETRQTEKKLRQQHQRRRQPEQPLQQLQRLPPLSHMTCEEAARAMVRRARRVNAEGYGEGGKGGGEGRGVFSVAEVAWLSIETVAGGGEEDRPLFTYHRSVDDLFGGEDEDEDRV